MSKISSAIPRHDTWLVVFYAPNNVYKVLFRSWKRTEAEASKRSYERLISSEFKLELVFQAAGSVMEDAA